MASISPIENNSNSFKSWAQNDKFGLSAKVGGGAGAELKLVKAPNSDCNRSTAVLLSQNESGPLKINAQVLLDAVSYAAQATINICNETGTDPSEVTIPVNYSFASVFASDKQALKQGQNYQAETDDNALVYANNFWIGDNKITNQDGSQAIDCSRGFNLKNYLLTQLRAINQAYQVTGKNGQWIFRAEGAPTIITNMTNDGNMVAMSAATSAGLKPNQIYIHSVQGGGGNLNIVITNSESKISEVINTEAFGKPLDSVFTPEEIETIKLIHGNRCDQNIERWTAGGSNDGQDGKGIKETIRHLKRLKDSKKSEITKVLGLSESEFEASSLLEEGFNPSNSGISEAATKKVKPQSFLRSLLAIFSKQNKDGDKLALALLKHQNWITAETIKRNPKFQSLISQSNLSKPDQLSYHGGTISGRLEVSEVREDFKTRLGLNKLVKHSPELDGSLDLTSAQLASKA